MDEIEEKPAEEVVEEATPSVEEDGPVINVEEDEVETPAPVEETPKGGEEEAKADETGEEPGEEKTTDEDDLHVEGDPEGVTKRIGKAVKRQYDAERERDYYKGLAEGRKGTEAPKVEPESLEAETDPAPVEDDFEDFTDFLKEHAAWSGRSEARKIAKTSEEAAQVQATETAIDKREQAHNERMAKAIEDHPEIREKVFENKDLALSETMFDNIKDSELGPEVALYLADNPAEAEKIYNLSPNATARAIGRIEAGLDTPSEPKAKVDLSKAPPPVSPSGGGGVAPKGNGDNLSDEDYIRQENEREAKRSA